MARTAEQTRLPGLNASAPSSVFSSGRSSGTAPSPGCRDRAPRRRRSPPRRPKTLDARHRADRHALLAAIDEKIGQIRSSVVSAFSRINRRDQSAWRLRRMRIAGKGALTPAMVRSPVGRAGAPALAFLISSAAPLGLRHRLAAALRGVGAKDKRQQRLAAPVTRRSCCACAARGRHAGGRGGRCSPPGPIRCRRCHRRRRGRHAGSARTWFAAPASPCGPPVDGHGPGPSAPASPSSSGWPVMARRHPRSVRRP